MTELKSLGQEFSSLTLSFLYSVAVKGALRGT